MQNLEESLADTSDQPRTVSMPTEFQNKTDIPTPKYVGPLILNTGGNFKELIKFLTPFMVS